MTDLASKFDHWFHTDGPAALVMREHLVPVEGPDGVVFPPTYAASEDGSFKAGYNIDQLPNGHNVCVVDSVGSQANRIEPLFDGADYEGLVPRVVVIAGDKRVSLLDAAHRAADAVVRCSSLQNDLHQAFLAVLEGDAEPLAKIAPTSLVFGAWDSRDTQAKLPRLIASTIRAFDVQPLTRSAQYVPAIDYVAAGVLEEPTDKSASDRYAGRGFVHVPSSGKPGGVIAAGGIRRDATLHLAALRALSAGPDADRGLALRRYVLGIALTAFTAPHATYLRQGANLVLDPSRPSTLESVFGDGRREAIRLTHTEAVEYARSTAGQFGVGQNREVPFDKAVAAEEVSADGKAAKKKASKKK